MLRSDTSIWKKDIDSERFQRSRFKLIFKLMSDTHALLTEYVSKHYGEKPFPDVHWMGSVWRRVRNKVAEKLKDTNIKAIRLYDLRHFYATMLYHKTKEISC